MTKGQQSEPPVLERGPKFLRNWSIAFAKWCKAAQPVAGIGVTISETPAGRVINARGTGGSRGGSGVITPFSVSDATEATDGAPKQIRIRQGVLKSDGTAWLPTGMYLGDVPPLIMPTVGTAGYVFLIVGVTGSATTGVTIGVAGTQPADTTSLGHLTLGTYSEEDGVLSVVSQNVGAQAHIFCGIEHHFARA